MLDCELRPGKQHCQNNTPEFLQKVIGQLEKLETEHPYLFRLDSGNDSLDNIKILQENKHFLLIKRNLRKESPSYWLDIAKSLGSVSKQREGKNVYTGVYTKNHSKDFTDEPNWDIVFKVTERTSDLLGNPYLIPEIEIETYWTNLYENPERVMGLYHDHGTSEQFHSELKTDMDVERLPSGDFSVNSLILKIAMIAFNTLRFIGQKALRKEELLPVKTSIKRKRLRKVITDLVFVACKLVSRSRQIHIRIWEKNPWCKVFQELYSDFRTI